MNLLDAIDDPAALRQLPRAQLEPLARQLRQFLLDSVSRTGGHLSSNLGTVELTIALHYVFDTPRDRLVWEVGHQCYGHKVLAGRRTRMHSLRQQDGLSGFPRRSGSACDCFGTAHSSTSISAAMSAGIAFEALNNAGHDKELRLLVILNDKGMSISPAVGGLSRALERVPGRSAPALFAGLGFEYSGPVDGHDLDALVAVLESVGRRQGPQFLRVVTRKGKAYAPAEAAPTLYHGTGKFDPLQGLPPPARGKPTYTDVFGGWLCDMAAVDARLVGITPAMREGAGMVRFAQLFADRYFDVALQNLDVSFAIDRAGLAGADGATHAGNYDIAFLRCIPNMVLMAASDEGGCRRMPSTAYRHRGPAAVRYPRGSGTGAAAGPEPDEIPFGQGEIRRRGRDTAILAFASMVAPSLAAGAELGAARLVANAN